MEGKRIGWHKESGRKLDELDTKQKQMKQGKGDLWAAVDMKWVDDEEDVVLNSLSTTALLSHTSSSINVDTCFICYTYFCYILFFSSFASSFLDFCSVPYSICS